MPTRQYNDTPIRLACADGDEGYFDLIGEDLWANMRERGTTLDWHNGTPRSDAEWLARIGAAHGLLLLWTVPDNVMRACPNLRAISWVGSGVETFVNVPLATELGIAVCNTPGYGANAVAEHALGLMLALARDTVAMDRAMREGRWPREEVRGLELAGKTLGIVGLGQIGTALGRMCAGLGMRVLAWNRTVTPERLMAARAEYADLPDLIARADFVSLHLAVAAETERIITSDLLARMKPSAYLINTARGELIDDDALLGALQAGHIAGAALDVFREEPLPADHPYRSLPNVILTPHVGFRTPEASSRSLRMALENLIEFFAGRPRHVVN